MTGRPDSLLQDARVAASQPSAGGRRAPRLAERAQARTPAVYRLFPGVGEPAVPRRRHRRARY